MEDRPTSRLADAIAQCCHDTFRKLPKHGKPTRKHNGQLEWTVIAAIILATPKSSSADSANGDQDPPEDSWDLQCLSLATGSKCLPRGKQSAFGDRLNDCHAEVLARRGFNLWCLKQMQACLDSPDNEANLFEFVGHGQASGPSTSSEVPPFKWKNDKARLHLYVSQAPCGDATTESLAEIQTEESRTAFYAGRGEETTNADSPATGVTTVETSQSSTTTTGSKHDLIDKRPSSVPTKVPRTDLDNSVTTASTAASLRSDVSSKAKSQDEIDTLLASKDDPSSQCSLPFRRGRIDYACITALRTKPGRVDSEPTLSMSCSDKIARWNVLGLNSALVASLLDQPLYLDSIVSHELFDAQALRRALYARFDQISILSALTGPSKVKAQEDKADEEEHSNAKIDQEPHDQDNQSLGYHLHRPKIWYTTHEFEFTKDAVTRQAEQEHQQLSSSSSPSSSTSLVLPVASPNSISWTAGLPVEVIVNGCKAGASAKHTPSRQLPLKSQSRLCKSQMFKTGLQLWEQVTEHRTQSEPESVAVAATTLQEGAKSYGAWKRQIAPTYQQAKAQLFQGALKHWVKGLPELEQFDVRGNIVANTIQ